MYRINTAEYVEIPADKIREAIAAAYDISQPQGLGMLHFQPGSLSEDEISEIEELGREDGVSMDYVKGRSCKFHVYAVDGRYFIIPRWFDHSRLDLIELLGRLGVADGQERIEAAIAAIEARRAETDVEP